MDSLDGQVALLTGAGRGIGAGIALELATRGARVALMGRTETTLQKSAGLIRARTAAQVSVHPGDVTDEHSVEKVIGAVLQRHARIDVLVNNAGIVGSRKPPGEVTAADMRATYDTNVFGVVRVTQAFLPLLEKSGAPVIVNVSSGLGSLAVTTDPARFESTFVALEYSSSKTAVNMLTSLYAKAYPAMRVNVVDPGYTATDLNGHRGTQTVAEGAEIIVRMAGIGAEGPTGGYFSSGGPVPW